MRAGIQHHRDGQAGARVLRRPRGPGLPGVLLRDARLHGGHQRLLGVAVHRVQDVRAGRHHFPGWFPWSTRNKKKLKINK